MSIAQPILEDPIVDAASTAQADALAETLEQDGIVQLPRLVSDETLREMQAAFAARLTHLTFNNVSGYERTEKIRLMVQDVLTLSQGFVDIGLHPLVTAVLDRYCGPGYELCEAKGWRSQPTLTDFHGWHGDAWYDQTKVVDRIPREVKLAFYLTDVNSGAFQFLRKTHGKQSPKLLTANESAKLPMENLVDCLGPAGTAVLFDTSGIHRQGIPILEPRHAVFYNYHDSSVPLQKEDVDYYRYHPLILNAAFLGGLNDEHYRILGFGNKTHYQPKFRRTISHPAFHRCVTAAHYALLRFDALSGRVFGKLNRLFGRRA